MMLRRCIKELYSCHSVRRIPRPIAQAPYFLSSRCNFSSVPKNGPTQKTLPPPKEPQTKSYIPQIALGSVAVGAAVLFAYNTGVIGYPVKNGKVSDKIPNDLENSAQQVLLPNNDNVETESDPQVLVSGNEAKSSSGIVISEEVEPSLTQGTVATPSLKEPLSVSTDEASGPKVSSEESLESNNSITSSSELIVEQDKMTRTSMVPSTEETHPSQVASDQNISVNLPKAHPTSVGEDSPTDTGNIPAKSLTESYSLDSESSNDLYVKRESNSDNEVLVGATDHLRNNQSSDGKLLLDLIEAVHAAEKRQAELDASIFGEEKRVLKERYEKALKDARAREVMYAEEAAILDKELKKEKAKAASALKLLQEKAEETLKEALQNKDEEAAMQLKKVQELAKAELAAAIAKEKSSQIEKMAEADLNINALCMAFYARSEEARQTHSVHKLALGTLALEDALSKGLPIRAEVDALYKSLEGIDKESLLELALSSLPEEILIHGTCTQMQLDQKFKSLEGNLRHFSLIPSGGGGILTHMVASVASSIKMKEDESGDGIESLISKIENFLIEGRYADAADALEKGVSGSEAKEIVEDWVRQARNRAVAEQALSLLQSYAMSITFS